MVLKAPEQPDRNHDLRSLRLNEVTGEVNATRSKRFDIGRFIFPSIQYLINNKHK